MSMYVLITCITNSINLSVCIYNGLAGVNSWFCFDTFSTDHHGRLQSWDPPSRHYFIQKFSNSQMGTTDFFLTVIVSC